MMLAIFRKRVLLFLLVALSLSCSLPGVAAPQAALPTFDPYSVETIIAETAAAAQTQTAIMVPTITNTATLTPTPTITPTFTPTFFFSLNTPTLIPTETLAVSENPDEATEEGEDGEKKKEEWNPYKMTGKEWTCSVIAITPPQGFTFGPNVRFNVKWTLFNSGTKSWPNFGVDLVYEGGLRHEGTKIQDFNQTVPSGGKIQVGAVFTTPKREGEYSTFFHLMVGKTTFCRMAYYFNVIEK